MWAEGIIESKRRGLGLAICQYIARKSLQENKIKHMKVRSLVCLVRNAEKM